VKALRTARNLTVRELAAIIGVSPEIISRIERGSFVRMATKRARRLAHTLKIPLSMLSTEDAEEGANGGEKPARAATG
jgi:transcriptional regulator with XRE-family HTH domain